MASAPRVNRPVGKSAVTSSPTALRGNHSTGPTVRGFWTCGLPATSTPSFQTAVEITSAGCVSSVDSTKAVADFQAMNRCNNCILRCRSPMSSGSGAKIVHWPSGLMTRRRGVTSAPPRTTLADTFNSARTIPRNSASIQMSQPYSRQRSRGGSAPFFASSAFSPR